MAEAVNVAYNMDCMEGMKQFPDKHFFLAVCDPPYGIARFQHSGGTRLRKYGQLHTVNDIPFTKEMFAEIQRVSEHQIVWGYNHLCDILPPCTEFIFWYKHQPVDSYADGELAYTNFGKTAKCFDYPHFGGCGADKDGRIHPSQKPIPLYEWLYSVYITSGGVFSTPSLEAAPAVLQPITSGWTLSALKSTRNTLKDKKNASADTRRSKICFYEEKI